MASTTIGTISLHAKIDTKQFIDDSKKLEKTAKSTSDSIAGSAENAERRSTRSFSRIASSAIAGVAKVTGIMTGLVTGAITGMVLQGGISRALNIEDAQAKLRGLGHDVQSVEKIMESALASVKGTAFGLDAAATAAASAVAAGVKPGQELTKYLSTAADAATIAGVSFDEMSSIFGKVQTQQRAYTQELNQLADRGIPIYQWLQKELGLTQEELREMVAAGELDSKTYFKVIKDNIGGAALESGKTTRGAWANMRAAMARVGAAIVKDIIPRVREGFGSLTKWFDDNSDTIVESVGRVVEIIKDFGGQAIALGRRIGSYLSPKLSSLLESIKGLLPVLKEFFYVYLKPAGQIIGTVFVGALGLAINTIRLFITAITPVISWLNQNRAAVLGLVAALGTLAIALKIQAGIVALDIAIAALRMSFIASTISSVGLTGAIGALGVAVKGFLLTVSPVTTIILALSAAAGVLTYEWLRSKNGADRLRQAQDNLRESSRLLKDSQDDLKGAALTYEGAQLRVERAQRTYNDAVKEFGPDSLEAREAQNQLEQATLDVTSAFDGLIDAEKEYANQQVAEWKAEDEAKAAQNAANKWNELAEAKRNAARAGNEGGNAAGFLNINNPRGFSSGGFTGRGNENEPAGVVHKGEYVLPKSAVDQTTGMPKLEGVAGEGSREYNIGTININSEVDGERWLRKLTGNQEITSAGLVPTQSYMG